MWTIRALLRAVIILLPAAPAAFAEQHCIEIRIAPGESETTIFGIAPPEAQLCYLLETQEGRRTSLKVTNGKNIMFSIVGVTDGQDEFSFLPRRRTYRIMVGQLMRSITEQPFIIRVSVSGSGSSAESVPANPGRTGSLRTGEVIASTPAERSLGAEVLEKVKDMDFNPLLRACEREFLQIMPDRSLWKLNLDPRSFSYVNKERIHIHIQMAGGSNPEVSRVILHSLIRGRSFRGGYGTVCMTCFGTIETGKLDHVITEALPLGQPCPGG
jgi:hypothetical protein